MITSNVEYKQAQFQLIKFSAQKQYQAQVLALTLPEIDVEKQLAHLDKIILKLQVEINLYEQTHHIEG